MADFRQLAPLLLRLRSAFERAGGSLPPGPAGPVLIGPDRPRSRLDRSLQDLSRQLYEIATSEGGVRKLTDRGVVGSATGGMVPHRLTREAIADINIGRTGSPTIPNEELLDNVAMILARHYSLFGRPGQIPGGN